ncbi:Gas vesicle synthesis protein GvpL/GvpF [Nonomuraea coxensis DSM 45129]|uniref:Gas vesicle synthesis protein GvpL/GvpF n=1 Tax=Nonomuraea coxensis DSM 45129 TaxID=1122611 RepID=A0ABX8TTA4_9ACTN|nr:GvpL/GvpF family gas vesicle protein [Nonomuraea coxensis]QYC38695.1 Gas vesicle synthesis protein GvpL/GvpF [Nonomuraea coxensis DSM 45129]
MSDTGTYLYAVARDEVAACPPGVADADVRTIALGGLVAYVSDVPLERFGEEPLRRSLEDMDWLAGTARAHHRVVDAVAAATPTAPVRLVTVYDGDEQVRDLLERRAADFAEVLEQVIGRREWGVKAFADPGSAEQPDERPGGGGCEQSGKPGTAYLQRRRANLRGREQNRRQALARAEHIHAALATVAVASRRHRPQDPRLSGRADWMLLNGAYLVDEGRVGEFAELAGELGGGGIEVTVTGPWAPYSFTVMETR